ncbi:MAG: DUF327 family protein [Brevinema sp.]
MKIINTEKSKKSFLSSPSKSKNISPSSFSQMIEEHPEESILDSLFSESDHALSNISVLAEELDKIGQLLAEKPLPENFYQYKKHIRLLLKGAGRNMVIQETTGRSGLTRTKLFRTAQAIDQTLGALAQRILNDEKNRIEILKLTDQLKGLILDILT